MADTGTRTAVTPATPSAGGEEEAHKAVQRRYYEAMDARAGSPEVVDEFFEPGALVRLAGMPPMDVQGFKDILATFSSAFPDLVHHIEAQIAEGDIVAARNSGTATHLGEFQGVPATGRRVTLNAMVWQRIAGGRIAEMWVLVDVAGLMHQLTQPG